MGTDDESDDGEHDRDDRKHQLRPEFNICSFEFLEFVTSPLLAFVCQCKFDKNIFIWRNTLLEMSVLFPIDRWNLKRRRYQLFNHRQLPEIQQLVFVRCYEVTNTVLRHIPRFAGLLRPLHLLFKDQVDALF